MSLFVPTSEMLARIDEVRASPAGRRVGVLGLGVAGRAMALYLARRGAKVFGIDSRDEVAGAAELMAAKVELLLGGRVPEALEALVISPGVDPRQPLVKDARARGVPVFGELELLGRLPAKVAGITGTNGKSTTTALLGALLLGAGERVFVGGNFGVPVASFVDGGEPVDTAVIELSSFQLETAYRFRAEVAVVLNLTPDHLDRYDSFADYGAAKRRICESLTPRDVAILSYDDANVRAMAAHTRARVFWLSTGSAPPPGDGAYLDGDTMVPVGAPASLGRVSLRHERLLGRHNRENAIAAFLASFALGVTDAAALGAAYQAFVGLEHRLELLGEVRGVCFINDSKATNDDAAAIAVAAMSRPTVLMLGGRGKAGGYRAVLAAARAKAHTVVAYGEARGEIAEAFAGHQGLVVTETFAAAFRAALDRAREGDVVLLSPACASFDEFTDYTARGRAFARLVCDYAEGKLP